MSINGQHKTLIRIMYKKQNTRNLIKLYFQTNIVIQDFIAI
jgi:hypothetical protein